MAGKPPENTGKITFEELKPIFHKWAYYFGYINKFDHWELINSAWAYGMIKDLPRSKIKCASNRIRYDMIDYMRNETNRRNEDNHRAAGKSYTRIKFFTDIDRDKEDKSILDRKIQLSCEANKDDINIKNLINYIIKTVKLDRLEKLILKLYFLAGYKQVETCKVTGYSESYMSMRFGVLFQKIKNGFLINNGEVKAIKKDIIAPVVRRYDLQIKNEKEVIEVFNTIESITGINPYYNSIESKAHKVCRGAAAVILRGRYHMTYSELKKLLGYKSNHSVRFYIDKIKNKDIKTAPLRNVTRKIILQLI